MDKVILKNIREKNKDIVRVISTLECLRNSHPDIVTLYMEGQCYNFSKVLVSMMDETAVVMYDHIEGHVYVQWKGYFWDIRGPHRYVGVETEPLEDDGHPPFLWGAGDERRLLGPDDIHPLRPSRRADK